MSGWLTGLGPSGTALALLLLGHVLGDFLFQTDELARTKHRLRPLLAHVGIVLVVHLVALALLVSPRTAVLVVGIVVMHFFIDAITARLRQRGAPSPHLFLGDQAVHVLVIFAGWSQVDGAVWTAAPVATTIGVERLPWAVLTTGAVYLSAFVFAHKGGNAIVRGVLPADGPETTADDLEAGSLIGSLERWIVLLLGVAGLWEAVALVVAAKSVARFEELKQRAFAEYFLVGTLTSVLVAIALVGVVTVLV